VNAKGIALVATLALMVVIALLVFGTFFTTQIELWTTRNDTTSVQAFYAAEAGLQKYKAALFQQYVWREQQGGTGGGSGCFTSLATGLDLDRDGTPTPFVNNQLKTCTSRIPRINLHSLPRAAPDPGRGAPAG